MSLHKSYVTLRCLCSVCMHVSTHVFVRHKPQWLLCHIIEVKSMLVLNFVCNNTEALSHLP